ncbi:MAG: hypothetical protein Q8O16_01265 [Dehalococcoidia bacterium]|nr:hypothetical protein [Dehalococcoidia bacterium]
MFWGKKSKEETGKGAEKLSGPREIPATVQKTLVEERKLDPDLVKILKVVVRKSQGEKGGFDIRIFDASDAEARKVQVKDYLTLDGHPELTLYEGWFDEGSKSVTLEERKKVNWDTTLFTQAEIMQKIEALSQPGSTVFFYLARGPGHGGPLGIGAAVIELTPPNPQKKVKKYTIYTTDVVDMEPVGKGTKLFDSDKAKDIAKWVKEAHHKRMY